MLPKSPRLRRILFAYTVNELGTWFGYVALALGVYDNTHSAIATAGLFVARGLLPALLAPVLVARTERSTRRGRLAWLYVAEAVLTLALAALLWHFWLAGVLILVTVDGIVAVAATALVRASASRVAVEDALAQAGPDLDATAIQTTTEAAQREASAALNVAFMGALALAPALGGALVHAVGGPIALLVDALTFVACAGLFMTIAHACGGGPRGLGAHPPVCRAPARPRGAGFASPLCHRGRGDRGVRLGGAGGGPLREVNAERRRLRLRSARGGLGCRAPRSARSSSPARCAARSGRCSRAARCWWVSPISASPPRPRLRWLAERRVVGGIGNGIQWPSLISAVQQLTPSSLHGRLMSAVGSLNALCPAIGFALGGTIAALSSPAAGDGLRRGHGDAGDTGLPAPTDGWASASSQRGPSGRSPDEPKPRATSGTQ